MTSRESLANIPIGTYQEVQLIQHIVIKIKGITKLNAFATPPNRIINFRTIKIAFQIYKDIKLFVPLNMKMINISCDKNFYKQELKPYGF